MYRCQKCGINVPAGTKQIKVAVASRPRVYEPKGQGPGDRGRFMRGSARKRNPVDKGGEGTELVSEQSVCPTCAPELYGEVPKLK